MKDKVEKVKIKTSPTKAATRAGFSVMGVITVAVVALGGFVGSLIANKKYDREAAVQTKYAQILSVDILEFERQIEFSKTLGFLSEDFDFDAKKEEYLQATQERRMADAEAQAKDPEVLEAAMLGSVSGVLPGALLGFGIGLGVEALITNRTNKKREDEMQE